MADKKPTKKKTLEEYREEVKAKAKAGKEPVKEVAKPKPEPKAETKFVEAEIKLKPTVKELAKTKGGVLKLSDIWEDKYIEMKIIKEPTPREKRLYRITGGRKGKE